MGCVRTAEAEAEAEAKTETEHDEEKGIHRVATQQHSQREAVSEVHLEKNAKARQCSDVNGAIVDTPCKQSGNPLMGECVFLQHRQAGTVSKALVEPG